MARSVPRIGIIGAGPVGCTASLLLSKNKIKHTLIEKAKFPRDKVCGDGFTFEVLRVLNEIDPKLGDEFKKSDFVLPSGGVMFQSRTGRKAIYDCSELEPDFNVIYVSRRLEFDNWLFNQLNSNFSEVYQETEVLKIERKEKGFEVFYKTHPNGLKSEYFDFLIGADGERSVLKKYLHPGGIKKHKDDYYGATRTYFKNVKPSGEKNNIEFHFLDHKLTGYFWIFPLPNNEFNVGICVLSNQLSEQKVNLKKEFEDYITNNSHIKDRFENAERLEDLKGWGIPLNSYREKLFGEGYLILGDSAYMSESNTGKGIGTSMFSTYLAMPTILDAINKNDFSENQLKKAQAKISGVYYKEWDQQKILQKWMYNSLGKRVILNALRFPFVESVILRKAVKNMARFSVAKGLRE